MEYLQPFVDNARGLGKHSKLWTALYSVNGVEAERLKPRGRVMDGKKTSKDTSNSVHIIPESLHIHTKH